MESDVSPMDAALKEKDIYIVKKPEAKAEAEDKAEEKKPEPAAKP